MKSKNLVFFIITSFFILFSAFRISPPEDSNVLRQIIFNLRAYYEWHPQQKVYLHVDKNRYNVDETVYFKAYVLNASHHRPDSVSTNLYVDLINPSGYIVQTKILRLQDGFGNGDFNFHDTVPEGNYRITAYTNWMRNTDNSFFFHKDVYVSNPIFKTYATHEEIKKIKKSHRVNTKKARRFDIDFLPEGGNLLSGIENRVAFKAINELGRGLDIKAELIDNKGNSIMNFESEFRGMGSFRFTPETGRKYYVNVTDEENRRKKIELPEIIEKGIGLRAWHSGDSIGVEMVTNIQPSSYPSNPSYYLVAHMRGQPGFSAVIDLNDQERTAYFDKNLFTSGIVHLTLFNQKMNPVSERLIFIYHPERFKIEVTPSTSISGKREKNGIRLKVSEEAGKPVDGNYSLSVSNINSNSGSNNILSNLLLTSDLKGEIEEPSWYFKDFNSEKEKWLDYIMLTNGWRRFDWHIVMLNEKMKPEYTVENGLEISGRITRNFFNLPLRDILVQLTIMNQFNDTYVTRSDLKGNFFFEGLNYPDTIEVKIEAEKANGSKNLVIVVNETVREQLEDFDYFTDQMLKKPGSEGRKMVPVEDEDADDPFAKENNYIHRLHEEPRDVIIVDEQLQHYQNVAQILQGRVPGVNVSGNRINIRGINSFYSSTDPLFLLDGVPIDQNFALSISPYDLERIEVLKGPETAIYGSRGANGVIAMYTKRGKFMLKGVLDFSMLGYAVPKEFYSPRYDLRPDDTFEDDRTTLFWEPYLRLDENGGANVDFFTSDVSGEFLIRLEGINNEGGIVLHESFVRVK